MRSRILPVVALLSLALPVAVAAQDAEQDRYDAAIEWANKVMVENDFDGAAAAAHDMVAAQLTPAMLQNAMSQLTPQLGPLNGLTPKNQTLEQGFHQVVLNGAFANGTFDVLVIMSDDHRVAGFFVRPPA